MTFREFDNRCADIYQKGVKLFEDLIVIIAIAGLIFCLNLYT